MATKKKRVPKPTTTHPDTTIIHIEGTKADNGYIYTRDNQIRVIEVEGERNDEALIVDAITAMQALLDSLNSYDSFSIKLELVRKPARAE